MDASRWVLALALALTPWSAAGQSCRAFHESEREFRTLFVGRDSVQVLGIWQVLTEELVPGLTRRAVRVDRFVVTRPGHRPMTLAMVPPVKGTAPNEAYADIVARYARLWCDAARAMLTGPDTVRLRLSST